MNPFEMVVLIVAIVMIAGVLKSRARSHGVNEADPTLLAENDRLRGDVKQLQQRVKVLEKIVTDRGADTAAQIEALRERDRITEGDEG